MALLFFITFLHARTPDKSNYSTWIKGDASLVPMAFVAQQMDFSNACFELYSSNLCR